MNDVSSRYLRSKAIFLEASGLASDQRNDFIESACEGDDALRAEVQSLFAETEDWGDALDRIDVSAVPGMPEGYRAERELGRGGMGVVWLAVRDDANDADFQQRVALKLLVNDTVRDGEKRARFRAERRILASLEHPNIARLIDGGSMPDGTLYLAMEYVEGECLDVWIANRHPELRDVLRLFVSICRAVQSAHQRLIVHRDLKPANILVDSRGEPKLLDFGIAKLLEGDAYGGLLTGTGMQMLTPRYAAPEQVRGEVITTATDVYALGVILYELLTGQSPYGRVVTTAPDQLRAICDTEPLRPSQAVFTERNTDSAQPPAGPFAFSSSRLRGDLDAITMKCLRKAPDLRYRGAAELADDIESFLGGRPVIARDGNLRYAVSKFLVRHRYLAASSVLVLLVLAAATGVLMVQLERTREQRDIAASERDKAERVTGFVVDLLRNADPTRMRGEKLTVREALARGETELDRKLAGYPETEAYLLEQLSSINIELGDPVHALELAERAVEVVSPLAASHPALLDTARYAQAVALIKNGRGKEVGSMLRAIAQSAAARGDLLLQADATGQLATVEQQALNSAEALNLQAEAQQLLLQVLQVESLGDACKKAVDETNRPVLEQLAKISQIRCGALTDARETDAAYATCSKTAELKSRLWPPDHPIHLTTQETLATLLAIRGETTEAKRVRRAILEASRHIYGANHTKTAYAAFNLGVTLKGQHEYEEAESLYREALHILGGQLGPEHRSTLVVMNNLANLLTDSGSAEQGLAMHHEVLALRLKSLGERHADVAQSHLNIATAEAALGRNVDAVRSSEKALDLYKQVLGPDHHDTVLAMMMLAQRQFDAGQFASAQTHATMALAAYEKEKDVPDEKGATRFLLARAEWELGNHALARASAAEALVEARLHGNDAFDPASIERWLDIHPNQ